MTKTASTTRKQAKGTTKRVTVGGKKSERVTVLQKFRAGADKEREGKREKNAAIKSMLAIAPHGTPVVDPADNSTWLVVNEPYTSEPKASAWDALLSGDILTAKQREQARALFDALAEDKTRQNITKA